MVRPSQKVQVWRDVDLDVFENEIIPRNQPAVLKSIVKDWPAVAAGRESPEAMCRYLRQFDTAKRANATVGPPGIDGRFFYRDDLHGFNFERKLVTIGTALDNLAALIDVPDPPAIAMQAVPVADVLPGFEKENDLCLIDPRVAPRLWLGNKTTTATHYDNYSNIACVVAGRRRFTLFPPEEVANLYIGPLLNTPGGSPISMVNLRDPDFSRYPRFEQALEVCQQADLEPGDALYIPILWWHAAESLEQLNVLVNYWWNHWTEAANAPFESLVSSILAISELPGDQRAAWREFFDYFVFRTTSDPAAHLPENNQDVLGTLPPDKRKALKAWLSKQLRS